MADFVLPIHPSAQEWELSRTIAETRAAYSVFQQSIEIPGTALWTTTMEWPDEPMAEGAPSRNRVRLEGLMTRLSSRKDTLLVYPYRRALRGTLTGSPVVNGGNAQFSQTISLRNATPGATIVMGDFIGVNGLLLRAAEDADATGGGLLTFRIEPELRLALSDGMAIALNRPQVRMQLISSARYRVEPGVSKSLVVQAIEVPL